MQASTLSGSEKTVNAVVGLLSAYGAYQGAEASHQADMNRAKIDSWRVELDELRSIREQSAKILAAELSSGHKVAQAAAPYEFASHMELDLEQEAIELRRSNSKSVSDDVAQLLRITQASWQFGGQ